jgi:hypothetical protein
MCAKKTLILAIVLSVLASTLAMVSPAAAKTAFLAQYFPSRPDYPKGYQLLPLSTSSAPGPVFGPTNESVAQHSHFVLGATQAAVGHRTVVTIIVARFRAQRDATHFRAGFQSGVHNDGKQKTGLVRHLGAGAAQYVSGSCAACGAAAPTLAQVFFTRGPMFVSIGIQPTDVGKATRLAGVIDSKLKRAHMH